MNFVRPRITLSSGEHGAIVVTIDAIVVDGEAQPVKDEAGQVIVQHSEQFQIFESGFGKQYVSELAFSEGGLLPAFVIDREGFRHFVVHAPMGLFNSDGGEAACKISAGG